MEPRIFTLDTENVRKNWPEIRSKEALPRRDRHAGQVLVSVRQAKRFKAGEEIPVSQMLAGPIRDALNLRCLPHVANSVHSPAATGRAQLTEVTGHAQPRAQT